ncbi:MAG: sigma-70 family RNA polymerase sigma factor [Dehalococcoidia bacterium]|nr:MAG: sigma-70 family RNA polymerase sigma factor [Dehalococcoidia bacterium]
MELYDKYYSQIFGYVLRRTANIVIAQDVTSQTFIKALDNLGHFQWRGVPFSSWLFKIASNEIANNYNKQKRRQRLITNSYRDMAGANPSRETELAQAEETLIQHEEFVTIHQSIAKLPLKYQEVISLRYFEHKQIKEIGETLGKSEGTVKSLLHRALKKLRVLME